MCVCGVRVRATQRIRECALAAEQPNSQKPDSGWRLAAFASSAGEGLGRMWSPINEGSL